MRIFNHFTISCIFSFLFFNLLFPQSEKEEKQYTFVNIKDGLTQRAVSSIVQDQQGFIWMGTNGAGLNKFNGLDFVSYAQEINNPNSLNSSLIHSLYVDSHNRMWVGTEEGLNLYNKDLDQFEVINLYSDETKTKKIKVFTIIEGNDGTLFIGTHEHGLFKLNPDTLKASKIILKEPYHISYLLINSLIKTNDGDILAGTNEGLFKYNVSKEKLHLYDLVTQNNIKNIQTNIETMLVDNKGVLWIGTENKGLIRISLTHNGNCIIDNYKITEKRILSMLNTPDGNILCGTENDGLFVISLDGKIIKNQRYDKFDKNSIKSNSIWSLFLDKQQRIWIGYYNNGVGVYDKFYDKFQDIESIPNTPNSLQSGSVTGVIKDSKERLWIAMDGGGVDVYDQKAQKFSHLINPDNKIAQGLNNIDTQTIFIDSNDNIWIGTWGSGIYYLKKNGDIFTNFNISNSNGGITSNRILSFAEDSDGIIWIGSFSTGLHSFDPKSKKFTHYSSSQFETFNINYSDIRKVFIDSENFLWICSNLGVYKIDISNKENLKVIPLTNKIYEGLGHTSDTHLFLTIFEDSNQNLWIGTDGDGLCKYNSVEDSFFWYNKTNGLDKETVSSIIEDENKKIWIAGNKGISKLDTKTDSISNFTMSDGLLSNDFNNSSVYKSADGTLYFGNYKGINYFNPNNISINQNKPLVYLSDFKLFNKSVIPKLKDSPLEKVISETNEITLNHQQSVFTIDFVCINYTRSEKNKYAYYLEGFENSWNYVGNTRSATYTNLPSGNYIFKVKAANNDGIWNEIPTTLKIQILPPWWLTSQAIFYYILLSFLLIFLIFIFINLRAKEKRLIKSEREKRIQEEELNNKKIQFFTNISHEFRTPLTLILNPIEDIISNNKLELPEKIKRKHRIIHKNVTRLNRLIDELMDFRRLQFNKISVNALEFDLIVLIKEIASHFEEEASQRNIMLIVNYDDDSLKVWGDTSMLEKIIFNILSNAFKVTPENGAVTININETNSPIEFPLLSKEKLYPGVEISIEDTGSGIKKEEIEKIFERFYQAKEIDKQYYGGTGIGLEVVRSFIDLHKGKVHVESKVGKGTTFRVFLPLGNSHFQSTELLISNNYTINNGLKNDSDKILTSSKNLQTTYDKNRKTLLIIEDNLELRNYLKDELIEEYIIIDAVNGREGLEKANKIIPDIIITDIIMPEMDGYEFCTHIKNDLKTSHIPLLMLTAKAMNDDWVKGIDSGADVYLHKPFDMKVLKSQLKQLINSRQILFNKYFNDISKTNLPEKTTSLDKEFIVNVLRYINKNLSDTELNVENIADELFLSRSQLYRKIKALTGQTANEFLRSVRLEKAKQMIESSSISISEVSYKVGFSSPSYFSKCFKEHFNVLPTELSKNTHK